MSIGLFFGLTWFYFVSLVVLTVIGLVLVPKIPTDAQRKRAWLGLGLLLADSVIALIMRVVTFGMIGSGRQRAVYATVSTVASLFSQLLSLTGIAILVTVAAVGVKKSNYGVQPYGPQYGPTTYGAPGGQDSPIGTNQPYQSQQYQTQPGQTQPGQTQPGQPQPGQNQPPTSY